MLGVAEMCCEGSVALEGGLGDVFCESFAFLGVFFLVFFISGGLGWAGVGRGRRRKSVMWIDGWG